MGCCGGSSAKSGLRRAPVWKDMDWLIHSLLSGLPQQIGIIPPFPTSEKQLKTPLLLLLSCFVLSEVMPKSAVSGSVESNSGSILRPADTMKQR